MRIELDEINYQLQIDPAGFVARCDDLYRARIEKAADLVTKRMSQSRGVLLSGPSSSGKTTTAGRVRDALKARGIFCHMISLDDYYRRGLRRFLFGGDNTKRKVPTPDGRNGNPGRK